jgi:hypothetical protein
LAFLNYFSWNHLEPYNNVSYIQNANLKIIRHFTKYDNWEIIQTTDSTFFYFQYDSTFVNTINNGQLIASKNIFKIDTLITFPEPTFEEQIKFDTIYFLIKHGFWEERESNLLLRGNYKNNQRTGEWFLFNFNDDGDFRKRIYDNGKMISERQLNIMRTLPKDSITQRLIGVWYGNTILEISKTNTHLNKFEFQKEMLIQNDIQPNPSNKKWIVWQIDDNLDLIIMGYHRLEKYRIVYFFEDDWVKLERIEY